MTTIAQKIEQHLGWIILALLVAASLFVLMPFVSALLWAVVLCFSSWPIYMRVLHLLRGRRTLAAMVMSLSMILVVLVPFFVVAATLADNTKDVSAAVHRWYNEGSPSAPLWLAKIPLVGERAVTYWQNMVKDSSKLIDATKTIIEPASAWLLKLGLMLGSGLIDFTLSILVSFFLFRDGVAAAARLTAAIDRIGGERGMHLLNVASNTVRGVVYGILGTALTQAVVAGIGFLIAGIPGPGFLALLTFFLSVLPVGPPLIWIPAALWLFHQGSAGWGVFMLIWGVGVSSVDNFVKPWIISQGSDMPFLLILMGVLGGALAFGFIGVFLGPTLLAVVYRMIIEWAALGPPMSQEPSSGTGVIDASSAQIAADRK